MSVPVDLQKFLPCSASAATEIWLASPASSCIQNSPLLCFSGADVLCQVLKLKGCWQLGGFRAQSAVTKIAKAGCLEVLDVRDTSIDIDTGLIRILSTCPNLRKLCAPLLQCVSCPSLISHLLRLPTLGCVKAF